jgi:hypothetical protein
MVFEEMQRRKNGKKKKSSYLGLLVGSLLGFELHDELPLMNLFISDLLKYRCEQHLR